MLSMVVDPVHRKLRPVRQAVPKPGQNEVLLQMLACGVCRTDLHIIDGELPQHRTSVVPGHEIVGRVVAQGAGSGVFHIGQRVGVPWLGGTCQACSFCLSQRENLCDQPSFTGYDRNGGFAEYVVADERYCFALPPSYDDVHAAPLLCAGLIGYRAWRLACADAPKRLGLYGFGAAAHILCQLAVAQRQQVFAVTREGDRPGQEFARELGACWAGGSSGLAPSQLDAAIIFAPAGELVPAALAATRKGGRVVCAGIHMSPIPAFDYALLWGERILQSVANLTRVDGEAFFAQLEKATVRTQVQTFRLCDANDAVQALRAGTVHGAAVLVP